jgi:hypothetical protein
MRRRGWYLLRSISKFSAVANGTLLPKVSHRNAYAQRSTIINEYTYIVIVSQKIDATTRLMQAIIAIVDEYWQRVYVKWWLRKLWMGALCSARAITYLPSYRNRVDAISQPCQRPREGIRSGFEFVKMHCIAADLHRPRVRAWNIPLH